MRLVKENTTVWATFKCNYCGKDSKKVYKKKSFSPYCCKCLLGAVCFKEKAFKLYGDTYDYTKTEYKHSLEKVVITCKKHGDFHITPSMHLQNQGCPTCGRLRMREKLTQSPEELIKRLQNKFGNKYTYLNTENITAKSRIDILCPEHGITNRTVGLLLSTAKTPCAICTGKNSPITTEHFLTKIKKIHGDYYDYSKTTYITARDLITIICPIHGEFEQTAQGHMSGRGCISCSINGFNPALPGIVYYLYFPESNLYKIGISNRDINDRFDKEEQKLFIILKTWEFPIGILAQKFERNVISQFKKFKYTGEPIIKKGNTEFFIKDILNLNTNVNKQQYIKQGTLKL